MPGVEGVAVWSEDCEGCDLSVEEAELFWDVEVVEPCAADVVEVNYVGLEDRVQEEEEKEEVEGEEDGEGDEEGLKDGRGCV